MQVKTVVILVVFLSAAVSLFSFLFSALAPSRRPVQRLRDIITFVIISFGKSLIVTKPLDVITALALIIVLKTISELSVTHRLSQYPPTPDPHATTDHISHTASTRV